jgi:hypothetical protein
MVPAQDNGNRLQPIDLTYGAAKIGQKLVKTMPAQKEEFHLVQAF